MDHVPKDTIAKHKQVLQNHAHQVILVPVQASLMWVDVPFVLLGNIAIVEDSVQFKVIVHLGTTVLKAQLL